MKIRRDRAEIDENPDEETARVNREAASRFFPEAWWLRPPGNPGSITRSPTSSFALHYSFQVRKEFDLSNKPGSPIDLRMPTLYFDNSEAAERRREVLGEISGVLPYLLTREEASVAIEIDLKLGLQSLKDQNIRPTMSADELMSMTRDKGPNYTCE